MEKKQIEQFYKKNWVTYDKEGNANLDNLEIIAEILPIKFHMSEKPTAEDLLTLDNKSAEFLFIGSAFDREYVKSKLDATIKTYNYLKDKHGESFDKNEAIKYILKNWDNLENILNSDNSQKPQKPNTLTYNLYTGTYEEIKNKYTPKAPDPNTGIHTYINNMLDVQRNRPKDDDREM